MDILPRRENSENRYVPLIMQANNFLQDRTGIVRNLDTTPITRTSPTIPNTPTTLTRGAADIQPIVQPQDPPPPVKKSGGNPKKARGRTNFMPRGLNSGANALSPMGPSGTGGGAFDNQGSGGSQYNDQRLRRGG